jgi:hypothetical protein
MIPTVLPKVAPLEPLYRVLLLDDEQQIAYWATYCGHEVEYMEDKLKQAGRTNHILGLLNLFCCEPRGVDGNEVVLQDFVIDTPPANSFP